MLVWIDVPFDDYLCPGRDFQRLREAIHELDWRITQVTRKQIFIDIGR
jgi:hypothetical protein